jgi:aryl-alcohol dehydrogenase-like predicted oxidoreductase
VVDPLQALLGGPAVRRIGLGTAALGRPGYVNLGHAEDLPADRSVAALRAHAHAVLDAAHAAGIRYVDAARSYGEAEAFVASWLEDRGHTDVVLGSKWGYTYTARWRVDAEQHEVKDHSLATLRRQLAESRAVLGGRIALYQVHSASLATGVLENRAVLAALADLAEEGMLVGLSTSGPDQPETIDRALDVTVDGRSPFSAVQATWNLLEPSSGPALARAAAAGWVVLVKEGVANGRLSPRGVPADIAPLERVGAAHGVGPDAVALAAALAQPWADLVLSGAASTAHLRSNLEAAVVALSEGDLAALAPLAEDPAAYWDRRRALPWT